MGPEIAVEFLLCVTKSLSARGLDQIQEDDGIALDRESVEGTKIKEDDEYDGVRIKFQAELAGARIPMQIDIGFGDATYPRARACFISRPSPHGSTCDSCLSTRSQHC